MKGSVFTILLLFTIGGVPADAQSSKKDSALVVKRLIELIDISASGNIDDPDAMIEFDYQKAASYVVYRGDDEKRKWKAVYDYSNTDEKSAVDGVCVRIKNSVGQDKNYKITKYDTETESEGTWLIVYVSYLKKGVAKQAIFAFLKINGQFALGDID
jgi:hypothetical protein